ncbi:cell wall-associated NlpC family hydrolase [Saccharomonospora amisosensis]|uniref:Cell wall-associated NlpC family hydrolase n=1 Tax=Saccharomonospora amisosensis TaxID=1128677 RepID=A0A7X5ZRX7_9PSEU|nr:cell wall-associated NlpC family hydrolase [Saccharomonospora amisosensis]
MTTSIRKSVTVVSVAAVAMLGFSGTGSAMMSAQQGGGAAEIAPVATPASAHKTTATVPIAQRIVDVAASQEGKPYSYGASGPGSFDCSGLVQWVHRQVGIDLPRTSRQQRAAVPHIAKADMAPGDLVFFHNSGGTVYHVGIYAGGGRLWAAPEPGDVVRSQNIWTDSYTVGRAW